MTVVQRSLIYSTMNKLFPLPEISRPNIKRLDHSNTWNLVISKLHKCYIARQLTRYKLRDNLRGINY